MSVPGPIAIGAGRDEAEAQQRRRQRLEVVRVGEEREHLLGRAGQALLALKDLFGSIGKEYARRRRSGSPYPPRVAN